MNPIDKQMIQDILAIQLDAAPVAYVRPVVTDQGKNYAVCAADGTALALFSTEDAAYFAAKQHDLDPVLIH